jgi:hypothetical protein
MNSCCFFEDGGVEWRVIDILKQAMRGTRAHAPRTAGLMARSRRTF